MLYVDFDLLDCSQRVEFCCRIYAVDAKVWKTGWWQPSGGVTTHTECSVVTDPTAWWWERDLGTDAITGG